MKIKLPELALVALIGPSGSGKSTFARQHFKATEVLSSDYCRGLVSDDENDQSATNAAFDVLHYIAGKRLQAGKLTVVDATNVQAEDRKGLVALARQYHCLPVAIVFNLPERLCQDRNESRPDRGFGPHVVRNQHRNMRRSLRGLQREGFRHVFVLDSVEEVEAAVVTREPLWNNRKQEHGPFDIIGDIHGCYDELLELLGMLGCTIEPEPDNTAPRVTPSAGRKIIFLGDLVDRGPGSVPVVKLVRRMLVEGTALCVPGNHDIKLMRKLRGKDVQIKHGLAETLAELEKEPPEFSREVADFIDGLVSHYVFDDGNLVVAHAGLKEELQGRGSGHVREFALYGETTGETDQFGLPVRYNWAAEYRGKAVVVYGHTPVPEPEWLNGTINIDTGCVFGGKLTALRYPERELISVPAKFTYAEPGRPFLPEECEAAPLSAQQLHDDLLVIEDVIGKRIIRTRLHHSIMISAQHSSAALEVMSRFSVDPKWLIYLPPTMSPPETSLRDGLLEHPAEAFGYYRSNGIANVICEQKHMGSRAIAIVCRDAAAAQSRFGVTDGQAGVIYTRTGRRFFNRPDLECELLAIIRTALDQSGFWERLETNWVCLDCELMPWSAKAQDLLRNQYGPVGAAAVHSTRTAGELLQRAAVNGNHEELSALAATFIQRHTEAEAFVRAVSHYCWPAETIADYRLAPFHIMATEGAVHTDKPHAWHMEEIARVCGQGDGVLMVTSHRFVDLLQPEEEAAATAWWEELTGGGGEGMVVKPSEFAANGIKGMVQPAVKCRGPEYLRIIYGPHYTEPKNLERLRKRGLGSKRRLAAREFALGVEALERFVRKEPLRRVHECVFGVLALESEPVDPRL